MSKRITKAIAQKVLDTVDAGLVYGLGVQEPGRMCVEAAVCYALGLPHSDNPKCVAPALRRMKIMLNDSNWSSREARAKGLRRLAVAQLGSLDNLDEVEFGRRVARLAITTCVPRALRSAATLLDRDAKDALLAAAARCERDGTEEAVRDACAAARDACAATYADACDNAIRAALSAARAAAYATAGYDSSVAAAVGTARAAARVRARAADAGYDSDRHTHPVEWFDSARNAARNAARDEELATFCEGVVQILVNMKAPGVRWLALTEGGAS